jgi:hypothetical protein
VTRPGTQFPDNAALPAEFTAAQSLQVHDVRA